MEIETCVCINDPGHVENIYRYSGMAETRTRRVKSTNANLKPRGVWPTGFSAPESS